MNGANLADGNLQKQFEDSICNSAVGKLPHPEKLYIQHHELYAASSRGQIGLIKRLLEGGADASWQDGDGQSCLWVACWNGHAAAVQLLCEAGANVDAATRSGITPLMQATCCRKAECIKVLLANGADQNLKHGGCAGNLTALDIAKEKNYRDCIQLLENT
eukprot:CAMPEP_0119303258 /NCGR_PEP_ID=MMETSP1333-20130426/4715_1 /TAXON_ID=418940 /ORGANISM="Scyphosphaera apsteinii, Strain RCC1455" /LENGTH=160 /DNA_ID=CAMNT_0007305875 /DNA_START=24 /DNA_END=506 /DNA_ORIENTATION=+